MFFCQLGKVFKSTYFEELLQVSVNNDSKYNNNQFRENKPLAPTGIRKDNSWSICQLSCCCNSEYALHFHVTCIDQSNSNLLRSNYKYSLHIHAKALSKKLTCIHVDVRTELRLERSVFLKNFEGKWKMSYFT